MKANEIRIGNLIQINNEYGSIVCRVDMINAYKGQDIIVTNIENTTHKFRGYENDPCPIPLTEDWLEKFGLYKPYDQFYWTFNDKELIKFQLHFTEGKTEWYVEWDGAFIRYYKYVHQLQNLFFALTGEELEIK